MKIDLEEGDECPKCRSGSMGYQPVDGCSCHISPPCSVCIENPLVCDECGYDPEYDDE
jgi:hypothetical protein